MQLLQQLQREIQSCGFVHLLHICLGFYPDILLVLVNGTRLVAQERPLPFLLHHCTWIYYSCNEEIKLKPLVYRMLNWSQMMARQMIDRTVAELFPKGKHSSGTEQSSIPGKLWLYCPYMFPQFLQQHWSFSTAILAQDL